MAEEEFEAGTEMGIPALSSEELLYSETVLDEVDAAWEWSLVFSVNDPSEIRI